MDDASQPAPDAPAPETALSADQAAPVDAAAIAPAPDMAATADAAPDALVAPESAAAPVPDEPSVTVTMVVGMSGAISYAPGDPYTCGEAESIRMIEAGIAKAKKGQKAAT